MKILATLAAAAAVFAVTASTSMAAEMAAADCDAWFAKVDANTDGSLGGEEAAVFNKKLMVTKTEGDSAAESPTLDKVKFMEECQKGTFEGLQAN